MAKMLKFRKTFSLEFECVDVKEELRRILCFEGVKKTLLNYVLVSPTLSIVTFRDKRLENRCP